MKTKPFQFFNLISQGNSGNFVKLLKHQLQYLGPEDLTQYFVKSFNISDDDEYVKSVTNGKTGVRVDFIFSRRLLNQILTTFMPTVRKLTRLIWNKISILLFRYLFAWYHLLPASTRYQKYILIFIL